MRVKCGDKSCFTYKLTKKLYEHECYGLQGQQGSQGESGCQGQQGSQGYDYTSLQQWDSNTDINLPNSPYLGEIFKIYRHNSVYKISSKNDRIEGVLENLIVDCYPHDNMFLIYVGKDIGWKFLWKG